MSELFADPDYIKSLAPYQEEAAAAFGAAASAVSGIADDVHATHGVICYGAQDALKEAEEAHTQLANAMQNYSTELAAWLLTASCAYENTDDVAARNLNRQIT
ncbi:MAG: ESX-1 secretion-associated protein [Mycobacteriaceae bacterium]|nr:ESX-1 secretion-associated protein [Mycobacteriaceae bacterium]